MRSSKKRSLLIVNEHFESKRNDKVALLDSFYIYYNDYRPNSPLSNLTVLTAALRAEREKLIAEMTNHQNQYAGDPRTCYVDGAWNQDDSNLWLSIIQLSKLQ